MTDNKCPSCGAPMKLGARECGYCEYVAPAPKATEMSAEQKQQMLELKQMLLEHNPCYGMQAKNRFKSLYIFPLFMFMEITRE